MKLRKIHVIFYVESGVSLWWWSYKDRNTVVFH